jgi:TPR repeat protein
MGVPKDMKKAFELYQVAAELRKHGCSGRFRRYVYSGEKKPLRVTKRPITGMKASKTTALKLRCI